MTSSQILHLALLGYKSDVWQLCITCLRRSEVALAAVWIHEATIRTHAVYMRLYKEHYLKVQIAARCADKVVFAIGCVLLGDCLDTHPLRLSCALIVFNSITLGHRRHAEQDI